MKFIKKIKLIVATALPVLNTQKYSSPSQKINHRFIYYTKFIKRTAVPLYSFFSIKFIIIKIKYTIYYFRLLGALSWVKNKVSIGTLRSSLKKYQTKIYIMLEIAIICLALAYLFDLIITFVYFIQQTYSVDLIFNMTNNNTPTPPSDPVRWWPSGVPQANASVGSAIGTYYALHRLGVSPRGKVVGALAAAGLSSANMAVHSILEHGVGFNRIMWGLTEFNATGLWPNVDKAYSMTAEQLEHYKNDVISKTTEAEKANIEANVAKVQSSLNSGGTESIGTTASSSTSDVANSTYFLPSSPEGLPSSSRENLLQMFEYLFRTVMQNFQIAPVQGHFDDLVGQRMFIEFILFITSILVAIMFIIFLFNLIILFNKDRILNIRFWGKNKYIRYFIQYELFVTRITLLVIPFFIFLGLYTIGSSLIWILTHPIPYEALGVDLHQIVSSEKV